MQTHAATVVPAEEGTPGTWGPGPGPNSRLFFCSTENRNSVQPRCIPGGEKD